MHQITLRPLQGSMWIQVTPTSRLYIQLRCGTVTRGCPVSMCPTQVVVCASMCPPVCLSLCGLAAAPLMTGIKVTPQEVDCPPCTHRGALVLVYTTRRLYLVPWYARSSWPSTSRDLGRYQTHTYHGLPATGCVLRSEPPSY